MDHVERKLIEELRHGDRAAFRTLVQAYQDKVVNTCYGFLHNRQDAEDTAQEVFLEVYRSIRSFNASSRLGTWIYRIAVTKSLDLLRKMKRKKRMAVLVRLFDSHGGGPDEPADTGDPHDLVEGKERALILKNAVDTLPENQRIAVTLNRYEGFSYEETAEIMGISLSAVESLLHRAKKNLQNRLYHFYAAQQEF